MQVLQAGKLAKMSTARLKTLDAVLKEAEVRRRRARPPARRRVALMC